MFEPGSRFREYEILTKVGEGSFAQIYKAFDAQANRIVALKVLHPHRSSRPEFVARFERELQIASSMQSNFIPAVYNAGLFSGYYFIAQEFVSGRTLAEILEEREWLGPTEAVKVMLQLLEGLSIAHRFNVVHRDVKPENLMITSRQQLKIMDFGIARQASDYTDSGLTLVGQLIGTPAYMSPEACRSEIVDGRSDIYAAGITFFELLTGRTPFETMSNQEMFSLQINQPPPRLSHPGLDAIFQKAVAKDRLKRYQTAEEMAESLQRLRLPEDLTISVIESSVIRQSPSSSTTASRLAASRTPFPEVAAPVPRPARRKGGSPFANRYVIALAGIGVLAIVALLALVVAVLVATSSSSNAEANQPKSAVANNSPAGRSSTTVSGLALAQVTTPQPSGSSQIVAPTTPPSATPTAIQLTDDAKLYNKAAEAFDAKNWDEAVSAFEQLQGSYPNYRADDSLYKLGQAYLALNKYAEAQRIFKILEDKYPDFSVPGYDPDDFKQNLATTYCQYGLQIAKQEDVSKVVDVLGKCNTFNPGDPKITRILTAEVLYKEGREASADPARYKEAVEKLANLYANFDRPHRDGAKLLFELYNRYGDDLKTKGQLQEAANNYCAAAKLDPALEVDVQSAQRKCTETTQLLNPPTPAPVVVRPNPGTVPTPTPKIVVPPTTPPPPPPTTPPPPPPPTPTPKPWNGTAIPGGK